MKLSEAIKKLELVLKLDGDADVYIELKDDNGCYHSAPVYDITSVRQSPIGPQVTMDGVNPLEDDRDN